MAADRIVVSAPGKVLLAGGYLVLDQKHAGLVVATSSRFFSAVQPGSSSEPLIRVRSPQFLDAEWQYRVVADPRVSVVPASGSKNKFVQLAIERTLLLSSEVKGTQSVISRLGQGLEIILVGDNDFYSQRKKLEELGLPRTVNSMTSLEPFLETNSTLSNVHKTGLGSSAALTTALIVSLLLKLEVINAKDLADPTKPTAGLTLAHNLTQYVHCFAQGKVGSGFDVSSALFGSHVYRRFNPSVLEPLMKEEVPASLADSLGGEASGWDMERIPFQLPPLVRLVLADVDAGSDTPSLVGKVLGWRKQNPDEATKLWTELDGLNQQLPRVFNKLSNLWSSDSASYKSAVKKLVGLESSKWEGESPLSDNERPVVQAFSEARSLTQGIRTHMREMGNLAGVPIEPPEQTRLLDGTVAIPGIVGGGVPGAGGYDAIWILVLEVDTYTSLGEVERLWASSTELQITPLKGCESLERGVRLEEPSQVQGLSEFLAKNA